MRMGGAPREDIAQAIGWEGLLHGLDEGRRLYTTDIIWSIMFQRFTHVAVCVHKEVTPDMIDT